MFRVYYLVNSMDQVKTALKNVEQSDLGSNRVHVMARDNGELSREGIHATTPWEDTNIMTTGFYGAMVGAVIGLLVGWEFEDRILADAVGVAEVDDGEPVVNLLDDARDEVAAERFLRQIREQALPGLPTDSQLIGPLPSAMSRRAGRFRWQLWCLTHDRASARRAAEHLVLVAESHKQHRDLNWFLDVDPQEVS